MALRMEFGNLSGRNSLGEMEISLYGSPLVRVPQYKIFGILFEENMTWRAPIVE